MQDKFMDLLTQLSEKESVDYHSDAEYGEMCRAIELRTADRLADAIEYLGICLINRKFTDTESKRYRELQEE